MTYRPPPEAAFAVAAPSGARSALKRDVALDVRCLCASKPLLLRILRTEAGLLAAWRSHNRPTAIQLQHKGGNWPGGDQGAARVISRNGETRIADEFATAVGWWEHPDWYPSAADESAAEWWSGSVRCACGRYLVRPLLRRTVEYELGRSGRYRVLVGPRSASLTADDYLDFVNVRHRKYLADELARMRDERASRGHTGP